MTDPQEDEGAVKDLEDIDKCPNVSITICSYLDASHPFCRHPETMASLVSKISPSIAGDGGTYQGS